MSIRSFIFAGLCLLGGHIAASDTDDLQARIDEIAKVNVTGAWEESQALVEALEPEMHRATPEQRAQLDLLMARNMALDGRYAEAMEVLDPLLSSDLSPETRLRAYEMAANYALNQLDYENAFMLLRDSIALLSETDQPEPQARLLGLAGYFHSEIGEQEMALEYSRQALELARRSPDPREECIALHRLALAQLRHGDYPASEATHRQQVVVCEAAGDPVLLGAAENGLAGALLKQGKYEQAMPWIQSALQRNRGSGFQDGLLVARRFLARALKATGELDEAEAILMELNVELEARQKWNSLHETLMMLTDIAESRGDSVQALDFHRLSETMRSRWMERERAMRLAYLQVEFDTRIKEQELALLREQNRVLQLEEESRAQQGLIYIGGAIAMAVIGLLLLLLLMRSQADRRRFRKLSEYDGLTGLYNHTQFFFAATEALDDARHSGQPFTLVITDIDHFKRINDDHDHLIGDEVLRLIGARLRGVFGDDGIVGRIGGEEFGIALPGHTADRANEWVAQLRDRLGMVRAEDQDVKVSLSFGIAEAFENEALQPLRRRADQALYVAKNAGRDQVVVAGPVTAEPSLAQ